jgi:hypothetical protein
MPYYVKLIVVILIVVALAEVIPEAVNALLTIILLGMLLMQSKQYSRLIAALKF